MPLARFPQTVLHSGAHLEMPLKLDCAGRALPRQFASIFQANLVTCSGKLPESTKSSSNSAASAGCLHARFGSLCPRTDQQPPTASKTYCRAILLLFDICAAAVTAGGTPNYITDLSYASVSVSICQWQMLRGHTDMCPSSSMSETLPELRTLGWRQLPC